MPDPKLIIEIIATIEQVAEEFGVEDAYFVGGYPRALAMGLPLTEVHDLDIASGRPQKAMELAGFFAERIKPEDYEILHRTGTVRVTAHGLEIDFQGSSSHDDVAPYVRMWGVEETPLAKNVFDRDFTMNALAIRVGTNEILDITKRGMPDISDRRIASIIPPDVAVPKNPLMITRAIKFAARYGFGIERNLWKAMAKHVGQLEKKLSPERIAIEAYVLSKYPQAEEMLEKLGLKKLESPAMIEKGKEEVAAWSIGNQKAAQANLPTPWEIGLRKKHPVTHPEAIDPNDPENYMSPEEALSEDIGDAVLNRQQEDASRRQYADFLAERYFINSQPMGVETINGTRRIMFSRRLLTGWRIRLDIVEVVRNANGQRAEPVRGVSLGDYAATQEPWPASRWQWFVDLEAIPDDQRLHDNNWRDRILTSVSITFDDGISGVINPGGLRPMTGEGTTAWSIGNKKTAQSQHLPTPWEMGLNRKRPPMPDVHEDFLAERFYVNEHPIEVNVDGGKKTVMFSRRLLDGWTVRLDIVQVMPQSNSYRYGAVLSVRLGPLAAIQRGSDSQRWYVDLEELRVDVQQRYVMLDQPVHVAFSDGTRGMIALGGPRPMMREQRALSNADHACDGACEEQGLEHRPPVQLVRVTDPRTHHDWGQYHYCQNAIEIDRRRSLTVEVVGEETTARSAGNKKTAQTQQFPTPWEIGLTKKHRETEPEDPAIRGDEERNRRFREDYERQNVPLSDYTQLIERFAIEEHIVDAIGSTETGERYSKSVQYGQHLLPNWVFQFDILEISADFSERGTGNRIALPVRNVWLGQYPAWRDPSWPSQRWTINLGDLSEPEKRAALNASVGVVFSDGKSGVLPIWQGTRRREPPVQNDEVNTYVDPRYRDDNANL